MKEVRPEPRRRDRMPVSMLRDGQYRQANCASPPETETFGYDGNGNMTSDGRWTDKRDAENRIIRVGTATAAFTEGLLRRKVEYSYDHQGRIRKRVTYTGNPSTDSWTVDSGSETRMVYNGWQCIAELNSAKALQRAYMWGLDLSGSTTGAGGVGGLLTVRSVANGVHFVGYDGNGNVVALAKGSDGTLGARYDYDAFGNTIRKTGAAIAQENPWEFSTKRRDRVTGSSIYEYRQYQTAHGRWFSRDPIGEKGGLNLYGFVTNDPMSLFDSYGLCCGIFVITQAKDLPVPPEQLKGSSGKEFLDGFKVSFAGCEACACPQDKIRLVQAVKSDGLTGEAPKFDGSRDPRAVGAGIDYPPYGGVHGPEWPLSYLDAPNNGRKVWGETTFTMDVCAVCKKNSGDTILGCTSFTFGDVSRRIKVPNGKPLTPEDLAGFGATGETGTVGNYGFIVGCSDSPGSVFTEAEKRWRKSQSKP